MSIFPKISAPPTGSSNFLTGASSGLGYGLASAGANLLGQQFGSKSVNFRGKFARKQAKHNRAQIRPNQAELMKAMDDSGLHRLAALGITPGAGTQQPMIPGQSPNFGSAIGEGINTAMAVSSDREARANAESLAGLRLEEQSLRNDWLRTQIASSNMALMKEAANNQRPPVPLTPHSSEMRHREYLSSNNKSIMAKPGTLAEDFEKEINDWAQWMPSVIGRALSMFSQDLGNLSDTPERAKTREKVKKMFSPVKGAIRPNPRYRR